MTQHNASGAATGPVLGLDLGGTSIKWVTLVDGEVTARGKVPTPRTGVDAVLGALAGVATEHPDARALGVAVAGALDPVGGRLLVVPNIAGDWPARAIGRELADATGRPVSLANDARAFAYGQLRHGVAAGASDAVFVTLGTGIGGAIASDGQLRLGYQRRGGEIGHMPIEPDNGRKCGCGAIGCLESIAGGRSLSELGADLVRTGAAPALAEAVDGRPELVSPSHVVGLADVEPACGRLVVRAGRALGVALSGLASALAPEVIVFGGGVAAGLPAFRPHIDEVMSQHTVLVETPRIVTAVDGFAGALGAAAWAAGPPPGYPSPIVPGGH
ncbi:ROK family protein [Frankia sp. CNm7]|uniref:ROK family protein n=1 Tax=Frankia nepalensis TaxID=1836974 RepID=A0A937UPJ8_9ACTN|nr:ROK family protein [Frankia nepalensis]MBL7497501.1 ROK family protein [Frankia nepalensis]MBL7510232.1 ROK family protein [Frankia nepalensis]MBL7518652.1 ROK family protein [Frankia nepalensis]MBL7630944.1 ROK family protein [Frankia nepalensis]